MTSHAVRVDSHYCIEPSSIAEARRDLGLDRFDAFAVAERGLKPTYARVLLSQSDALALGANREFTHTLTIEDDGGRKFEFKRLGVYSIEPALEFLYESPDDPMIVTLTDNRRFLGLTPVDKRYNVLHPIMDGTTYYASTLKTDGATKRPWNWIEVIKNLWAIAFPNKPLAFNFSDLDVDPVTLEVNTTPDDDDRLLQQPVNLKFRGSFYGVMSWVAAYLGHEFLYNAADDQWTFARFHKSDTDIPDWGPRNRQKFVEGNLDIFLSNAGRGILPYSNPTSYYSAPKQFVIRYPKANYDVNAGQEDEDSDLGYHSLRKYLDETVDNPYDDRASNSGKKILPETFVAIYKTDGTQEDEIKTKQTGHAKKRAHLIASEYAATGYYDRIRFGGIPRGLPAPVFNQNILAISFRQLAEKAILFEISSGSNRLDDFTSFYRRYGRDFAEFRKDWHEDAAWEPNEEYVGHHRAYVELTEDLPAGKTATAKVLRFVRDDTDPDEPTYSILETADLELVVADPYIATRSKGERFWVTLSKQGKGWFPEIPKICGATKPFSGTVEVIDSSRGVYMDAGDMVIATRFLTFQDGVVCECGTPDEQTGDDPCEGERRIALCPADCDASVSTVGVCSACLTNRDDWVELENFITLPEQVAVLKMAVTGQDHWSNGFGVEHSTFEAYFVSGGYFGRHTPFLIQGDDAKYASIVIAQFDDPYATDAEVGLVLYVYSLLCVDSQTATQENIGDIWPDLVGVGGYILEGVHKYVNIGGPGFGAQLVKVDGGIIQLPFTSEDPMTAVGTYEAPNGTTYTFTVTCADTPVSTTAGDDKKKCCDPMPAALQIQALVVDLTNPTAPSSIAISMGEADGEYSSETPFLTDAGASLTFFAECDNGSIRLWAEDEEDNVYELGNSSSFDCDPFSAEFDTVEIPELNVIFKNPTLVAP